MSNFKLIVTGLDDFFFRSVFERLCGSDLTISLYVSHYPIGKDSPLNVAARIDASCFYHSERVRLAGQIDRSSVLDRKFLLDMLECERYFMTTMDRLSAKPQSITTRKILFRELLVFFKSLFEQNPDITHVFFSRTPHFGWDIVLFFVAEYFGVRSLILQRTDLNKLYLIRSDWRSMFKISPPRLDERSWPDDDIKSLLHTQSEFVTYSRRVNSRSMNAFVSPKFIQRPDVGLRFLARWIWLLMRLFSTRKKRWSDSAFFCNEILTFTEKFHLNLKRYLDSKKYLQIYTGLSAIPDLRLPYIYYAMHFQPERSTQPEGAEFEDQTLAIQILASSLPEGWFVYVKEHPRQFDSWPPDLRKMHARSVAFYQKISGIPRVKLVPVDFDSDVLIANSRLSSTITGSTGWEALKAGKPVIVFGNSWYAGCESCVVVESVLDAKKALNHLAAKDGGQVKRDCHRFLRALMPKLIYSYPGSFIGNDLEEGLEIYINSLAEGIIKEIYGS
jgi:hypothetical protein